MSEPQKEDRSYRWCWDEGDIIFVDDEPTPPTEKPGPVKNRAPELTPRQILAAAVTRDLSPFRARLERILTIQSPDVLKTKLQQFLAELPQLLKDLEADPDTARALEELLAPAVAQTINPS